jgi:hypothetical protein
MCAAGGVVGIGDTGWPARAGVAAPDEVQARAAGHQTTGSVAVIRGRW